MKKLFTSACVAAITLLILPLAGNAQNNGKPLTEANHSVSLNVIGADYAYEHPLGGRFSIIGRAGAAAGFAWGDGLFIKDGQIEFGRYFDYRIVPVVGVEARYYHSLGRREAKGRSTSGNSGSFLSMQARNYFRSVVRSDRIVPRGMIVFTSGWGMRRMWREHWMFEFNTGVNVAVSYGGEVGWSPALNVRFGYAF